MFAIVINLKIMNQVLGQENQVDTSWVTPMGKRAKLLIEEYNSEDPEVKAQAAEKIVAVCEVIESMANTGAPLTEAQERLMEIYNEIKLKDAA
jgi:hypothetical protein